MANLFVRGAVANAVGGAANITIAAVSATGTDLGVLEVSFNAADTISTVTANGAACTFVHGLTNSVVRVERWRKIAPTTGDWVVTPTANWTSSCAAGVHLFNGTDQVTPLINLGTASGSSTASSITLTSIGANNSGLEATGTSSSNGLSANTQTLSYGPDNTGTFSIGGSNAAGNASRTFGWTVTTSDLWVSLAAEVQAAASSAISANLGTSFHPGASPGLGGISSARFQPSNWWPYSPPPLVTFDPAFMIAMEKHGNDPIVLPPQVVASGMSPPEEMPT